MYEGVARTKEEREFEQNVKKYHDLSTEHYNIENTPSTRKETNVFSLNPSHDSYLKNQITKLGFSSNSILETVGQNNLIV